jgi:hypothetical protein
MCIRAKVRGTGTVEGVCLTGGSMEGVPVVVGGKASCVLHGTGGGSCMQWHTGMIVEVGQRHPSKRDFQPNRKSDAGRQRAGEGVAEGSHD